MRASKQLQFERLSGTRIIAKLDVLDSIVWPQDRVILRFAPDEVYITPNQDPKGFFLANSTIMQPKPLGSALEVADPHAIIISEGAFSGAWVAERDALQLLEQFAEWEIPTQRPLFLQGSVAGIATKLWLAEEKVLFIVSTPYADELQGRLS